MMKVYELSDEAKARIHARGVEKRKIESVVASALEDEGYELVWDGVTIFVQGEDRVYEVKVTRR